MAAMLLDYKLHSGKKKGKLSPAQKAGLAYEAKVLSDLLIDLESCVFHPALKFSSREHLYEYCIPDAMATSKCGKVVTIIEIKARHTQDAWMQLHNLYLPVVRAIWPDRHINLLEICKEFGPDVQLPGKSSVVDDLFSWIESPQKLYGVFPWSGR